MWTLRGTIFLLVFSLVACVVHPGPRQSESHSPKPFHADGCTWFPDGDYRDCCDKHDRDYWCGGARVERLQSDLELRQCVAAKGRSLRSALIYRGVRIGGMPWLPTSWRWGFGWRFGHGYSAKPAGGCIVAEQAATRDSNAPATGVARH
ncbi:MAG: hypothetical protein SGI99_14640 [Pseudomonadota bacterium]|nr:hypothetical protein [Pseudomonadota bacterium]